MQAELISTFKGSFISENKKIQIFVPGQGIKEEMKKKIIPYEFEMTPQTLEKIKINQQKIPKFKLVCKVDNTNCDLNNPFDGCAIVKDSEIAIKSLELQFVRNETVNLPTGDILSEISEIQNLQIGDGDVNRDVDIPLFMIFPRFFACASLETKIAKITFEINLIVVLINGLVITENFSINTWRS
jgi:hypothetical protein